MNCEVENRFQLIMHENKFQLRFSSRLIWKGTVLFETPSRRFEFQNNSAGD